MISNPKTTMKFVTVRILGLVAGALVASGCGAEGEGSIKAPSGGVEAYLGRPSGEPKAPPTGGRKPRSARVNAKVKAVPPDHTNPRS